jgi:hypothetical protein
MTLPTRSVRPPLADVLGEIETIAANIKSRAISLRDVSAAGNISALSIIELQAGLKSRMDRLNLLKSAAGLLQYTKDQLNDQTVDIVVEVDATVAEMQLTLNQIQTDLPTSAAGFVEAQKIETNDTVTNKTFTPAQSSILRDRLNALTATID